MTTSWGAPSLKAGGMCGVMAGRGGAALLVCSPYAWHELVQGRGEQGLLLFVALTLAGFVRLGHRPTRGLAVATGLAWAAAGMCYWFYAYFLVLVAGPLALAWAVRRRWRPVAMLAVAGASSALFVAPVTLPLLLAAAQEGSAYVRSAEAPMVELAAAHPWSSLKLSSFAWPAWPLARLRDAVPFTTSLPLVIGGVLLWRREAWLSLLGLAGWVLAMGWLLYLTDSHAVGAPDFTLALPFDVLHGALPGFWRMIWPYRLAAIAVVAAAGCAGAAVGGPPGWGGGVWGGGGGGGGGGGRPRVGGAGRRPGSWSWGPRASSSRRSASRRCPLSGPSETSWPCPRSSVSSPRSPAITPS